RSSDVTEKSTWPYSFDSEIKRFFGDLHQVARRARNFSHAESFAGIAMIAIKKSRYVNFYNISFTKNVAAGNAVADNFIYDRANAFRKTLVTERARRGAISRNKLVAKPVDLAGTDSSFHMRLDIFQNLRGKP